MGVKDKTVNAAKRLGWEATLGAIWLLVTAGGIVSFYFLGRGFTVAAQDAWFKTINSYLAPTWPTLIYGVLVASISSGIVFLIRYFNRRNAPVTLETMSAESLNKATSNINNALAELKKEDSERWQGMSGTVELAFQEVKELRTQVETLSKTQQAGFKAVGEALEGKGTLAKVKDAVVSKLPGQSEEA